MLFPGEAYRKLIKDGQILADDYQQQAVLALDDFYKAFNAAKATRRSIFSKPCYPLVTGLYLWGGVGRGKTWLADLLYDVLPSAVKHRQHFHAFMQDIQGMLKQHEGRPDPLQFIAKKLAADIRVLLLDEFSIVDIGDAMVIAQLLKGLFDNGISLLTTSNVLPEDLYNEGIQRTSFLPAIELLTNHTRVIHVGGSHDYRRQTIEQLPVYSVGGRQASLQFDEEFKSLCPGQKIIENSDLTVNNRHVRFKKKSTDVIWFEFQQLCQGPRHASDYLQIARNYHTLFLEDIPVLDGSRDDCARRFISMIDIFYDHKVKLIVSAQAQPHSLYSGERLAFEFQRTASRLLEMQSSEYLGQSHRD